MPFDTDPRHPRAGFTLLETILAIGIVGIVLGGTYTVAARLLGQEQSARLEYELTSMASSVLEEYIVTYPQMAKTGVYGDRWSWTITEAPATPLVATPSDRNFSFIRITATVAVVDADVPPVSLSRVITPRQGER